MAIGHRVPVHRAEHREGHHERGGEQRGTSAAHAAGVSVDASSRYFAPDITAVQSLVEAGAFHRFAPGLLPSL